MEKEIKTKKPIDYSKGKIYKIISDETDKIYIGSTIQPLSKRLSSHIRSFNCYEKTLKYISANEILKFKEPKIILIETFPCDSKEELLSRERYHIEQNDCVNITVPGRTDKEWREANKEYLKQYDKDRGNKYYFDHKEEMIEKRKI